VPFSEALLLALASLRAHKLRSFLTTLGIVIGVSSVIAVVAIIDGLDGYIADEVLAMGTGSFSVRTQPAVITSMDQFVEAMRRRNLRVDDAEAVRNACSACSEVGANLNISRSASWRGTEHESVQVIGATESYARIGAAPDLVAGRPLGPQDMERSRRVAVIGDDVRQAFFEHLDPIGHEIQVDRQRLLVIGVAEPSGKLFGATQDNFIWIPITTFQAIYGSRRSVTIQAEARSLGDLPQALEQVRLALRTRRHLDYGDPDDFVIETGESILAIWQNATRGIYAATLLVTAISLVVGGVVVMNIMLVSVTERIREIGIRRALGARRRDILRQFLVEAVLLSVAGGALGVLGAILFSQLLAAVVGAMLSVAFQAPVQGWAIGLALFVSSAVGVLAGFYPARQAAGLDPVAALRSE
jgi:putative ABC transport system permease protein